MDTNQEKLKKASSLLKEVDSNKGDLDKQIKLLNEVNALIADVNTGLAHNMSKPDDEQTVQSKKSDNGDQTQFVFKDKKVTATVNKDSDSAKSDAQKAEHSAELQAQADSQEAEHADKSQTQATDSQSAQNTKASEVHMSRKQYREMLNK